MKRLLYLPALVAFALFCSCEKRQTEAEKNAEIERQVQDRLAAEHQTQEQQRLTQAQMDLDQRLKEVEARNTAAAAATPRREAQQEPQDRQTRRPSTAQRMRDDSGDAGTATYSTFYTRLEPQGEWRETSNYGYVWQPRVAHQSRDWRPYTNGRWVYTDAGWTWISDEPFGWATYHYGRWTRLRDIGWVWVPGDEWAPAWVSWRKSNDYVGWAPLPPEARFERNSGIHTWADNYYDIGPDQYAFVPTNQLGDQSIERAVVPMERNVAIIDQTTNITNITYKNTTVVNEGPNYDEMRSRSRQPMERLRLERETTINFEAGDPHSVVRGEVVQVPAPIISRAQAIERPRSAKEIVVRAEVDHGWERVGDRQAAEKVRAKMKSEATPPPNAPSRTFVKPVEAAPPQATATAPESTPAPRVPAAVASPSATREVPAPKAEASVSVSTAPSPVPSATARPLASPHRAPALRPGTTESTTPEATATAAAVSPPTPPRRRMVAPEPSPQPAAPSPSVTATVPPSPPSAMVPSATRFDRNGPANDQRKAKKQLQRENERAAQSAAPAAENPSAKSPPSAAASAPAPSPAAAVSDSPVPSKHDLKKEEKREKKEEKKLRRAGEREGNPESSDSSSPSPSTPPQ